MDFLTLTFAAFLIISLFIYYLVPKKKRWWVLLTASLVFYVWSAPQALPYLLYSAMTTYAYGAWGKRKKGTLILTIAVNLSVLLTLKFYPLVEARLVLSATSLVVPMGISFYTLQVIAYCVDVYRGKIEGQQSFLKYLLFVSFFPQILQGPIPRYEALGEQLYEGHSFDYHDVKFGFQLILWGMFLKMVIADRAAIFVNTVFSEYYLYEGTILAVAAVLYSIQLYTDFLGCVCIAMGAARTFGIKLQTNFERPYRAVSVKDFWRRWHISLSRWLRDYIYIPLGGNRKGKFRKYLNLLVTFLVSGIWHGAGLQYLFWGFLQGFYQIAGEILKPIRKIIRKSIRIRKSETVYLLWRRACTFLLITASWVIFRAKNLRCGLSILKRIIMDRTPWVLFDGSLYELGISARSFFAWILCVVLLMLVEHYQEKGCIREWMEEQQMLVRWGIYLGGIALVAVLGVYGPGYNATQFLYGQF